MTIDRSVRIGVVTSLIATFLFIYFLDPILSFIGSIFIHLLSNMYVGLLDHFVRKAALGVYPDSSFFLLVLFLGLYAGTPAGIVMYELFRHHKRSKPQDDTKRAKSKGGISWKFKVVTTVFILLSYLFTFFIIWERWYQLMIWTSFEQHLTAVSPYISDQETKEIRSQWTLMNNFGDYEKLTQRIESVAAKNNIRLPENPVYSVNSF